MSKKKITLAYKKDMSGTDTLSGKSKYAQKIRSQRGGNYSINSPFNFANHTVSSLDSGYKRGINFFTPIDEDDQ